MTWTDSPKGVFSKVIRLECNLDEWIAQAERSPACQKHEGRSARARSGGNQYMASLEPGLHEAKDRSWKSALGCLNNPGLGFVTRDSPA